MELRADIHFRGETAYSVVDQGKAWDYYERPANFDFRLLEGEQPDRRFFSRPEALRHRSDQLAVALMDAGEPASIA